MIKTIFFLKKNYRINYNNNAIKTIFFYEVVQYNNLKYIFYIVFIYEIKNPENNCEKKKYFLFLYNITKIALIILIY